MNSLGSICVVLLGLPSWADPIVPTKGTFVFTPKGDQSKIPAVYQLGEKQFEFKMLLKDRKENLGVLVHEVTFPSPYVSPHPENNTIWCEFYQPIGLQKGPGVVILDILGGDQSLSRTIAVQLARQGIHTLFMQLAYYGPRKPKNSRIKLLSPDILQTINGIQQSVLDLRVAAAFLESRPEIDPTRIGITGTSLGSFFSALGAETESRFSRCSVLLGGGGFVDGFYDHPDAKLFRFVWEIVGNTKARAKELLAPYDPITRAPELKNKKLLIMAASKDEVVPPSMATALWEASGKQKIIWFEAGHYSAILHLPVAISEITKLMKV